MTNLANLAQRLQEADAMLEKAQLLEEALQQFMKAIPSEVFELRMAAMEAQPEEAINQMQAQTEKVGPPLLTQCQVTIEQLVVEPDGSRHFRYTQIRLPAEFPLYGSAEKSAQQLFEENKTFADLLGETLD